MKIFDKYCVSGWPKDRLPQLRRTLTRLIKYTSVEFYVGITGDRSGRFYTHQRNDWPEMFLVYQTSSLDNAIRVEQELIEWGWEHGADNSQNKNKGGGGDLEGFNQYWVYVLSD